MTVTERRRAGSARERVISVAVESFAEHGVAGTSLQMIADRLKVTKAAVYHQFTTKEDIVAAVIQPAMDDLEAVAAIAESQRGRRAQLDATLIGLVDLVVRHRQLTALLHSDPLVKELVDGHAPWPDLQARIGALLTGPDPDIETRIGVAMVGGGLMLAGQDSLLAELDDATLRAQLLATARRVLRVRGSAAIAR